MDTKYINRVNDKIIRDIETIYDLPLQIMFNKKLTKVKQRFFKINSN